MRPRTITRGTSAIFASPLMTAGASKFLRVYYGKVRDPLAALEPSPDDSTSADPQ